MGFLHLVLVEDGDSKNTARGDSSLSPSEDSCSHYVYYRNHQREHRYLQNRHSADLDRMSIIFHHRVLPFLPPSRLFPV